MTSTRVVIVLLALHFLHASPIEDVSSVNIKFMSSLKPESTATSAQVKLLKTRSIGGSRDEDEPSKNPCSKTLFGEVGSKYPLRITDQIQRFQEFNCIINFQATGNKFGDRIELTFLSFQVGQLEYNNINKTQSCPRGHLKLWEPKPDSEPWTGSIEPEIRDRRGNQVKATSPRTPFLFSQNNGSSSSATLSSSFGEGTFCGQMMSRKTVYYSSGPNLSLSVYLPSGRTLFGHSVPFNLFLTYRFIPQQKLSSNKFDAMLDFGAQVSPLSCDRVFSDCLAPRKCVILSPNHPGFYPGNLKCNFVITQYNRIPDGYKAHIVISQPNEYKISMFSGSGVGISGTGSPTSASSASKTPSRLTSECFASDHVEIHDGLNAKKSSLVSTFCGSGALPPVTSSSPEMSVTLYSAPFKALFDYRLELQVQVKLVKIEDSDILVRSANLCDQIYEGDMLRRGVIRSPLQSLPFNSTCQYKFLSNAPDDRIWVQFASYFVQDLNQWTSEQVCDVASLEIENAIDLQNISLSMKSDHNCSSSSLQDMSPFVLSRRKSLPAAQVKFCEKSSPRVCGRISSSNSKLPPSPCTLLESYLSTGPSMTISFSQLKSLHTTSSFVAHFEFIQTKEAGEEIEGTVCDRTIMSSKRSWGHIKSSRNTFLYGRGGQKSVTCRYKFLTWSQEERVRVTITSFNLPSSDCQTSRDTNSGVYSCQTSALISTSSNQSTTSVPINRGIATSHEPRVAMLIINDSLEARSINVGCLCSGHRTKGEQGDELMTFDLIGNEPSITFSVSGMTPSDDFETFNFEASYEFLPLYSSSRYKNSVPERRSGFNGHLILSLLPLGIVIVFFAQAVILLLLIFLLLFVILT